jgi:DNA-binding response OmpR family regulator
VEVALVRWPVEQERRERLLARNLPRLLLVENGALPPVSDDCLEDWMRVPVDDTELRVRTANLERRSVLHERTEPMLDEDSVLHYRESWVALPPVEARLMGAMLDRLGAVVTRDALSRAGWPEGAPGRNALDVHVLRLRRRVAPLGLVIRTVRSRGYLLESESRQMAVAAK